jgi:Cd2+/Zn2+-exporting ATPase
MDCGSCALTIEDGLRQLPGARRVSVDFTTESLEIEGEVSRESVAHRLRQLGYRLAEAEPPEAAVAMRRAAPVGSGFLRSFLGDAQLRVALGAMLAVLAAALLAALLPAGLARSLERFTLAAAVVIVGAPIFMKGLRALVFSRRINIDLLMTLAALGALLIGEAAEAAAVVLLFTFGEGLERFSAARARDSLRSLMALQPQTATLLQRHTGAHGTDHDAHGPDHDAHGSTHEGDQDHAATHVHTSVVPAGQLVAGDLILVKPGERIAADGVVRGGESSVDEAAVTGESIPIARRAGDAVLAGTVNAEGALEVEVTWSHRRRRSARPRSASSIASHAGTPRRW